MKRNKAPASKPTSPASIVHTTSFSKQDTGQTQRFSNPPEIPLALSIPHPPPTPTPEPIPRADLQRSDVPAILFEGDDVPPSEPEEPPQKFSTGPAAEPVAAPRGLPILPESYGTGRLLLAARDPKSLYAHWDLSADQLQRYSELSDQNHLTLRVHQENLAGPILCELPISSQTHHSFVGVDAPLAQRFAADLGFYPSQGPWTTISVGETAAACQPPPIEEPRPRFATVRFHAETEGMSPSQQQSLAAGPERALQSSVAEAFPLPKPLSKSSALESAAFTPHPSSREPLIANRRPVFGPESLGDVEDLLAEEYLDIHETPAAHPVADWADSWTPAQQISLAQLIGWTSHHSESFASADLVERAGGHAEKPGELLVLGQRELSSAGLPPAPASSQQGFWFNVNAELVIFGATEPGASVTLAGRPIQLRPDGTFSCRFALPDGAYPLSLNACSPRGETRHAQLHFSRDTFYSNGTGVFPPDPALSAPSPK